MAVCGLLCALMWPGLWWSRTSCPGRAPQVRAKWLTRGWQGQAKSSHVKEARDT